MPEGPLDRPQGMAPRSKAVGDEHANPQGFGGGLSNLVSKALAQPRDSRLVCWHAG